MAQLKTPNDLDLETHIGRILDLINDGIYVSDRKGRTLYINTAYERLTGLSRKDLVGRNVAELTGRGLFDTILNPQIVQTGEPAISVQTDRQGKKLVLNGYPILGADGQVALVVTFVQDITLMVHLREQLAARSKLLEKYRSNVEHLNAAHIHRHPLITQSPAMDRLTGVIANVAATDATILIQGETGVGKDVFAREIHRMSPRRDMPFLKVDCPTIPENLLESELFGHAPGAFTGARPKGKPGFFEMADKGTLFLDEIGELPLSMQAKLLRVVQDREIVRVGSTQTRRVDVRIISATNRDLEAEVRQRRFRSDLYYRLRVAVVTIPPLRKRREDILPLADQFLKHDTTRYKKERAFDADIREIFLNYRWPGNIRELKNLIQSLVITCDRGRIGVADLPAGMVGARVETCPAADGKGDPSGAPAALMARLFSEMDTGELSLKQIMGHIEKELLLQAIAVYGSRNGVAERFRMNRSTLFRKLRDT